MGTPLDDNYTSAQGTSMATPHVAGLCALILKANPRLTPAEVKRILRDTAINLNLDPNSQGQGRVDALAAVSAAAALLPPGPPPAPTPTPIPPTDPSKPPIGCLGAILNLFGLL